MSSEHPTTIPVCPCYACQSAGATASVGAPEVTFTSGGSTEWSFTLPPLANAADAVVSPFSVTVPLFEDGAFPSPAPIDSGEVEYRSGPNSAREAVGDYGAGEAVVPLRFGIAPISAISAPHRRSAPRRRAKKATVEPRGRRSVSLEPL